MVQDGFGGAVGTPALVGADGGAGGDEDYSSTGFAEVGNCWCYLGRKGGQREESRRWRKATVGTRIVGKTAKR
jgi:hypothetical protein